MDKDLASGVFFWDMWYHVWMNLYLKKAFYFIQDSKKKEKKIMYLEREREREKCTTFVKIDTQINNFIKNIIPWFCCMIYWWLKETIWIASWDQLIIDIWYLILIFPDFDNGDLIFNVFFRWVEFDFFFLIFYFCNDLKFY